MNKYSKKRNAAEARMVKREAASAPAVADDVVEQVVQKIRELARLRTIEMSCEVGKVIVEHFYDGDLAVWRDRGVKDASFRKLAERDDLPMSASGLYRCVGIYDLAENLGGVSALKHVGSSHLAAVLGLPPGEQKRLVDGAERDKWTVKQVEVEAAKIREKSRARQGRPKLPNYEKSIRALGKFYTNFGDLFGDLEQVERMEEKKARGLLQTVESMQSACNALCEKLRPFLNPDVPTPVTQDSAEAD